MFEGRAPLTSAPRAGSNARMQQDLTQGSITRHLLSLHNVWLLSVASVLVQMSLCLLLLRRQFRVKLAGMSA